MQITKKEQQNKPKKNNKKRYFTFGLGKERDYFVENLSMLISSGMPIITALDSIATEMRSLRMKHIIADIKLDIEAGSPLWKTLGESRLFPMHVISLIRLGEESGRLIDNLKVISIEQEKDRILRSKLRSAMMYPVFVLSLTVIIGIGIAWFILPKLATVFSQLKITLPLITKILINIGSFLGTNGWYVVPLVILAMLSLLFFIFSFSKTKFIGQFFLFSTPGIGGLIKEIELARFGYLLGTLLEAGLPITQALDSLASASEVGKYRKLFKHLSVWVGDGNSLQKSFKSFRNSKYLVPSPIQQLIVAGEQSGTLSLTLLKIGKTFEAKADSTTKNLSVILEPILLVIVWLGVVAVALAVILPIYNLIGGFNGGAGNETSPVVTATQPVSSIVQTTDQSATTVAVPSILPKLTILPTPLGYLNIRDSANTDGQIISKALANDTFEYTAENSGWYQVRLPDNKTGWVFGKYIKTINN